MLRWPLSFSYYRKAVAVTYLLKKVKSLEEIRHSQGSNIYLLVLICLFSLKPPIGGKFYEKVVGELLGAGVIDLLVVL